MKNKKIKGWAYIYDYTENLDVLKKLGFHWELSIFSDKKSAVEAKRKSFCPDLFKVVPVTITYKIPTKKK